MKKDQLNGLVRVMMLLCAGLLATVLFVPMWKISLDAPQYPEGLTLLIYANKLAGNVDIINGLNHYIGMKTLHANDFVEFAVLPYIIVSYALLALLTAIVAKPKLLYFFFIAFVCFGIVAMADFWRWEYHYGHDLNPEAAIVVPGMSYQPPLIGFKQLLNFGAFSIPDLGGWFFIAVGCISLVGIWITKRKAQILVDTNVAMMMVLMSFGLMSCSSGPEPIRYGMDNCYSCKMTISDQRFGAELVTRKGRLLKFDDSFCLLAYMKTNDISISEIKNIYITNFNDGHELLNIKDAILLQSKEIRGPMGGDLAASNQMDSMKKIKEQFHGEEIRWETIIKQ